MGMLYEIFDDGNKIDSFEVRDLRVKTRFAIDNRFQDEYARTTTLRIPEWYFYAVLPLMGVMMFLRTLVVMVEDWRSTQDVTGEK